MSHAPKFFRTTLVGFAALVLAMGIGRFVYTPMLPIMQDDGLIDISGGGLLASVHFLGYWIGAALAAKLPWAPRPTLRFALLAVGASTLGMGITDSFVAWSVLRWIAGVSSAWALVLVGNYTVKSLADHGAARYQGWVFSGVGGGIAVAGLGCLGIMVAEIGSLLAWQIIGALSLVCAVAVSLALGPEFPTVRRPSAAGETAPSPLVWSVIIAYGAAGIGYIIPATFLPVMAREIVQSPLVFGWAWPVFGAAAFLSTGLAAKFQGRFSNRQVWATSQIVMAVGLLLPALHPQILTITIAAISVGGTFMIITMAGMKEAHRIAPPGDVMRHIAVMTAAFATGQMIGPVFAGVLYGWTQDFGTALIATSAALVITATSLTGLKCRMKVARP